jgi:HD-like signal output (HDOD) protein
VVTEAELDKFALKQPPVFTRLPRFSPIAVRLMALVADDEIKFSEIAKLISADPSLSSEVLRLANSPLYRMRTEIKSILHGLSMVGLNAIRNMVLTSSVWHMVSAARRPDLVRMAWRHNLATALLCEEMADRRMEKNTAYTAGLMHGIGQLALIGAYANEYGCVLQYVADQHARLMDAERIVFGVDHCQVGRNLLTEWRLPGQLVESAGGHHYPQAANFETTVVVHAACRTADHFGFQVRVASSDFIESPSELPEMAMRLLQNPAVIDRLLERINSIECSLQL